jgi:hypothetical protein
MVSRIVSEFVGGEDGLDGVGIGEEIPGLDIL